MSHSNPCSPVTLSAPRAPRGGRGFEARYQAWLAACAKVEAHNARQCADDAQAFWGRASCNDCADGFIGTPHHQRQPLAQMHAATHPCMAATAGDGPVKLPVRLEFAPQARAGVAIRQHGTDAGWTVINCDDVAHAREVMASYPNAAMPCWRNPSAPWNR